MLRPIRTPSRLFQKNCASCHRAASGPEVPIHVCQGLRLFGLPPRGDSADARSKDGIMKAQAAPLPGDERQKIANFLGTAVAVERRRDEIANPCPANAPWKNGRANRARMDQLGRRARQHALPSGGPGPAFKRTPFPPRPLKWAFAFPDNHAALAARRISRPVFSSALDGSVYALDAAGTAA